MANDTKERILEAALEMFSQNGYAGTNIRELSASLGLVKSGVYKHYESKEAIWNALLDEMKKVESLSKIQSNPYKYVQAWFLKQFPECKPVHLDKNSEEKNATEKAAG